MDKADAGAISLVELAAKVQVIQASLAITVDAVSSLNTTVLAAEVGRLRGQWPFESCH